MSKNGGAQIIDIVRFMPERRVLPVMASNKDSLDANDWFRPPRERRFAHPDYSSSDLGYGALKLCLEKNQIKPEKVDLILYSCVFSDDIAAGIGPSIQYRVKAARASVLEVDSGCASFLSMLNTARAFIDSGVHHTIAIVTVTNFISRLTDFQKSPKSVVLGDGASATLVSKGKKSIISCYERSHGENYGLLSCRPQKVGCDRSFFWDPHSGPLAVEFSFRMVKKLRDNAINLVSEATHRALEDAQIQKKDISLFITHQPNIALMKRWREAVGIETSRVHDTFERYGNLFQGSIPVTLSDALQNGKLKKGDLLLLSTFSNGGDFVSSMVLEWQ